MVPKNDLSSDEETSVVIGDLVEQHGMTKQNMILRPIGERDNNADGNGLFLRRRNTVRQKKFKDKSRQRPKRGNHLVTIKIATIKNVIVDEQHWK